MINTLNAMRTAHLGWGSFRERKNQRWDVFVINRGILCYKQIIKLPLFHISKWLYCLLCSQAEETESTLNSRPTGLGKKRQRKHPSVSCLSHEWLTFDPPGITGLQIPSPRSLAMLAGVDRNRSPNNIWRATDYPPLGCHSIFPTLLLFPCLFLKKDFYL